MFCLFLLTIVTIFHKRCSLCEITHKSYEFQSTHVPSLQHLSSPDPPYPSNLSRSVSSEQFSFYTSLLISPFGQLSP
jgi:hypothetical protein